VTEWVIDLSPLHNNSLRTESVCDINWNGLSMHRKTFCVTVWLAILKFTMSRALELADIVTPLASIFLTSGLLSTPRGLTVASFSL